MILKNFWYVAELSSAITNKPKGITMLGQNFVLYRDINMQVVAFPDLCPHCGAALSKGWVEDGCICCPYHGWKYQSDGTCIEIPTNPSDTPIPQQAHLDAYPVQEQYGWVWLFLGDISEAERPPLPPLPEFGDKHWRGIYGDFQWNAPYNLVLEHGIDIAHQPFIHHFPRQVMKAYGVHLNEWSGSACVNLKPPPYKGLWKYVLPQKRLEVKAKASFYMPNINREDVNFGKNKFILFAANIPIDQKTTITKWLFLRNFLTHPWADWDARRRNLKTFKEDRRVVETQRPELLDYKLSVPSDVLKIAYRQLLQKCLDRGWGIERHQINSADYNLETV